MKKITILSPDAVPLPLKEDHPEKIKEGSKEFNLKDKCSRVTAPGKRSWRFAEHLSKNSDFEVTLLVPNINFPGHEFIDDTQISFKIKPYNYKAANWEWSEELDGILKHSDFVVLQTTSGTGFQNCAVLPRSVNVILDGWIPFLAELPCVLLSYHRIYRKVNWTKKFLPQYKDVLQRANCILYANTRQHYHYEGQLFMIEKLDWTAFKFSPLLKIPYGIDDVERIKQKPKNGNLSLLWYGPVYPWYNPEILMDKLAGEENIKIDFVGIVHPRYKRIYNNHYKRFFDAIREVSNMSIVENYCDNTPELFKNDDAGIVISRNWIEEIYSNRCRIIDMAANGLPVIINEGNTLYEDFSFMHNTLLPISTQRIKEDIHDIAEMDDLAIPDEDFNKMHEVLNWNNVLLPLVDYIRRF
jgi:hypothetical protein